MPVRVAFPANLRKQEANDRLALQSDRSGKEAQGGTSVYSRKRFYKHSVDLNRSSWEKITPAVPSDDKVDESSFHECYAVETGNLMHQLLIIADEISIPLGPLHRFVSLVTCLFLFLMLPWNCLMICY